MFRFAERTHNAGNARGEHGFSGAGRTGHHQMMAAGSRHFQRPFGRFLPHDFVHISGRRTYRHGAVVGIHVSDHIGYRIVRGASHQFDQFADVTYSNGVDVGHKGRLVQIGMRYDHLAYALIACMQQNRQQTVDGQYRAIEIHLSEHDGVVQAVMRYHSGCAKHARCDRQIV